MLLDLHNNQYLHFKGLAQEQAKTCWALQKLLQPTTSPAMSPVAMPPVMLTKLTSTDDPDIQCAAAAWEWLEQECNSSPCYSEKTSLLPIGCRDKHSWRIPASSGWSCSVLDGYLRSTVPESTG